MSSLPHAYDFDPTYGYDLDALLRVEPPEPPPDFAAFWRERFQRALKIDTRARLEPSSHQHAGFRVYDLWFDSTDGFTIGGWLLEPKDRAARRGFVMGHGYGGIGGPGEIFPFLDAAYCVPCFRGLCRSRREPISDNPIWHVLHDIHLRDRYILGGCVEDLWCATGALIARFPILEGHIGYMGISFGGGIGAMALAWDERIARGHLNVPSFGHQALRLRLPTAGSGASVQAFERRHGHVMETLSYYDAASAARWIHQPMHVAAALFDPYVAPPGQFAIYNALRGEKRLFVLDAGHHDYPNQDEQGRQLYLELQEFFEAL